jgi:hypothetical protein
MNFFLSSTSFPPGNLSFSSTLCSSSHMAFFFWFLIAFLFICFGLIRVYRHWHRELTQDEIRSLKGQRVMITGAGSGIGRELAILYASSGARSPSLLLLLLLSPASSFLVLPLLFVSLLVLLLYLLLLLLFILSPPHFFLFRVSLVGRREKELEGTANLCRAKYPSSAEREECALVVSADCGKEEDCRFVLLLPFFPSFPSLSSSLFPLFSLFPLL